MYTILLYYLLSFISGIFLSLQVGINGQLRKTVGSPILSSFISFFIGALCLGSIFCIGILNNTNTVSFQAVKNIRWWMLTGGVLGAFYIFSTIFVSPKMGFGNMFCLVICGQLLLSILIDHFGLLGNEIHSINLYRIIGVILLISGVYLIQKK